MLSTAKHAMKSCNIHALVAVFILLLNNTANADIDLSGSIGVESRYFFNSATRNNASLPRQQAAFIVKTDASWQRDNVSLDVELFGHLDQHDSARTRGDAKELMLSYYANTWEVKAGIGQVFWGQTESQHRVDIINQTDGLGNPDGEDKLGQSMLNVTFIRDWGSIDVFALPSFRERQFSGDEGRLGFSIPVSEQAVFEDKPNWEWAARAFYSYNNLEFAVSGFHGIERQPQLIPQANGYLLPHYQPMQQVGIDSLYVSDAWLWKAEAIHRKTDTYEYTAATAGFEYTSVGIINDSQDIGWIAEYSANTSQDRLLDLAQNDLFLAARWIFNDNDSSEILFGISQDLEDSASRYALIEGSTRLNEHFRLGVNVNVFSASDINDPLYSFRDEDLIQFNLTYHY